MGSGLGTPEQMLMEALKVLKKLGEPFNIIKAREPIEWDTSMTGMDENPQMERINFAPMSNYVIYAAAAKKSAMKKMPKNVPRISWSINRMPENEAVTGGSADTIEQAMRFGEIAYRAIYGVEYKGDA
jgi:hypothetical protein